MGARMIVGLSCCSHCMQTTARKARDALMHMHTDLLSMNMASLLVSRVDIGLLQRLPGLCMASLSQKSPQLPGGTRTHKNTHTRTQTRTHTHRLCAYTRQTCMRHAYMDRVSNSAKHVSVRMHASWQRPCQVHNSMCSPRVLQSDSPQPLSADQGWAFLQVRT